MAIDDQDGLLADAKQKLRARVESFAKEMGLSRFTSSAVQFLQDNASDIEIVKQLLEAGSSDRLSG